MQSRIDQCAAARTRMTEAAGEPIVGLTVAGGQLGRVMCRYWRRCVLLDLAVLVGVQRRDKERLAQRPSFTHRSAGSPFTRIVTCTR